MLNVGDLLASLGLNTDNFTLGLKRSVRDAQKAGQQIAAALTVNTSKDAIKQSLKEATEQTHKLKFNLKDTGRVMAGIVTARFFNDIIRGFSDATNAVKEYNSELQQTRLGFEYLLKTNETVAEALTRRVQKLAAYSPFNVSGASSMAKQMLAMGVSAKTLERDMYSIADAVAATGGSTEVFERVGYALGQIHASSKLLSQDMRQLVNAGIPAWEILRDELGMSQAQLNKAVTKGLNSQKAYDALISGMQKRYAGAAKEQSQTWQGLSSTIQDLSLQLGAMMANPFMEFIQGGMSDLADGLAELVDTGLTSGAGGVLESVFGEERANQLRRVVAYLSELGKAFKELFNAAMPFIKAWAGGFLNGLEGAIPSLTLVVQLLAKLLQTLQPLAPLIKTVATAWATWKIVGTVTSLVKGLTKALAGLQAMAAVKATIQMLGQAFMLLAASIGLIPAICVAAVAAIALLLGAGEWLGRQIDKLYDKLSEMLGLDYSGILPTEELEDYDKAWQDYLDSIDDGSKNTEEALEDATDAADKFVASFDELFRVKDDEALDALNDINDGLDDINKVNWDPELLKLNKPDIKDEDDDDLKWQIPIVWKIPPFPDPPEPDPIIWDVQYRVDGAESLTPAIPQQPTLVRMPEIEQNPVITPEIVWPEVIEVPDWQTLVPGVEVGVHVDADAFEEVKQYVNDFVVGIPDYEEISIGIDFPSVEEIRTWWHEIEVIFPRALEVAVEVSGLGTAMQGLKAFANEATSLFDKLQESIDGVSKKLEAKKYDNVLSRDLKTVKGSELTSDELNAVSNAYNELKYKNMASSFPWTQASKDLKEYTRIMEEAQSLKPYDAWRDGNVLPMIDQVNTGLAETNELLIQSRGPFKDYETNAFSALGNAVVVGASDAATAMMALATAGQSVAGSASMASVSSAEMSKDLATIAQISAEQVTPAVSTAGAKILEFAPRAGKAAAAAAAIGSATQLAAKDVESLGVSTDNVSGKVDYSGARMRLYSEAVGTSLSQASKDAETWKTNFDNSATKAGEAFSCFATGIAADGTRVRQDMSNVGTQASNTSSVVGTTSERMKNKFTEFANAVTSSEGGITGTQSAIGSGFHDLKDDVDSTLPETTKTVEEESSKMKSALEKLGDFFRNIGDSIASWWSSFWKGSEDKPSAGTFSQAWDSSTRQSLPGYATGGIIDREQIVRVGEGNKRESIIPLEDASAMSPFADAVADRLASRIPTTPTGTDDRPIMHVGTLIADDRSLRELERRMEVIREDEERRRG